MSSSSSLAAARRRRAQAPQVNIGQSRQNNSQQISYNDDLDTSSLQNQPQSQNKASTPMQLLTQHDMRLHSMEQILHNLSRQMEAVSTDDFAESMNDITHRVTKVENNSKLNSSENIAYFKEKYINIEKQLGDMKKLLLKVQTFSMETNLAFLKFKNQNTPTLEAIIAMNEEKYKTNKKSGVDQSDLNSLNNSVVNAVIDDQTSMISDSETLDDGMGGNSEINTDNLVDDEHENLSDIDEGNEFHDNDE